MVNNDITGAALDFVRAVTNNEDYTRARKVDQAITADGKPNLEGRDFLPLRAPDGSTWRIRVNSDGTLRTAKVEGT